jgi:hypothetical protein
MPSDWTFVVTRRRVDATAAASKQSALGLVVDRELPRQGGGEGTQMQVTSDCHVLTDPLTDHGKRPSR